MAMNALSQLHWCGYSSGAALVNSHVVVAKDFLCPHGQPLVPHEHTSLEDLDLHRLISLRSAHPFFSDALRRGEREAGMLLDQKPAPGPGCTFRPKPLRFQ